MATKVELEQEVSRLEEQFSTEIGYLLDEVQGLEIENDDLRDERDIYKEALEDILSADDTSTLEGAIEIARAALETGTK